MSHSTPLPVILMADDNIADQEISKLALKKAGIECRFFAVNDGAEAIDFLTNRNDYTNPDQFPKPDLLLLDMDMPRLNGREVLEKISKRFLTSGLSVIVWTSSNKNEDRIHIYKLGARSYIQKPFGFQAYVTLFENLFECGFQTGSLPN